MPLRKKKPYKNLMTNMIKAVNIQNILLELLIGKEMTKLDLATSTDLSDTTVSDCINYLVDCRLLESCRMNGSTGGRRPVVYRLSPAYGYCVGIWVKQTRMEAAVMDLSAAHAGNEICQVEEQTPLLYQLEALLDRMIESRGGEKPFSIGLSMADSLDAPNGIVIHSECGCWANVPVREILERRYGTSVFLEHTVNCCACYLQTVGKMRHLNHFLCLMQRCPDKAALVMDGRLCRGINNRCGSEAQTLCACAEALSVEAVVTDMPRESCGAPPALYQYVDPVDVPEATALYGEIQWFARAYDKTRMEGKV